MSGWAVRFSAPLCRTVGLVRRTDSPSPQQSRPEKPVVENLGNAEKTFGTVVVLLQHEWVARLYESTEAG